MTDPFDTLREPVVPLAPRPAFARELRRRIAAELGPDPEENTMPSPNGHPPPPKPPDGPPDLLAEAEAVRDLLHDAAARLGRLIAALRQQKRQTRAIRQAVESLRGLPPFDT